MNWQSKGAVSLELIANCGKEDLFPYKIGYFDPEKALELAIMKAETAYKVGSDSEIDIEVNFNNSLVFSLLGGKVVFHETGPIYKPLINDWNMLKILPSPQEKKGLINDMVYYIDYMKKHKPDYLSIGFPKIQSPLNTAAILRGPEHFYMDCLIDKDNLHKLMQIVTEATIWFVSYFSKIYNEYSLPICKDILSISDDCCTNLSPDLIKEFDVEYLKQLSETFNKKINIHYCVLQNKWNEHCRDQFLSTSHIAGITNQYPPEYFLENYRLFERKIFLISGGELSQDYQQLFGGDPIERIKNFESWAKEFLKNFVGKSGLKIVFTIPSIEEAQEVNSIWESLNKWT